MTGRNPMHTGLDPMNWTATSMRGEGCDPPRELAGCDSSLSPDYVFLPRLLRSAGYESGMLGKVRHFTAAVSSCRELRSSALMARYGAAHCCSGTWALSSKTSHQLGVDLLHPSGFLAATRRKRQVVSVVSALCCGVPAFASSTVVGINRYDTHMLWNGRWNLSRDEAGHGGYVGPWITDLYETDHAVTDPSYNGTCTSVGVCTCADRNTASNICRYSTYMCVFH